MNETMAKTMWPGRDPLGECLFTGPDSQRATVCARIIGIVADARRFGLREEPSMHYYLPFGQESGFGGTTLLVRPRRGTPATLVATARAMLSVAQLASLVPAFRARRVNPMEALRAE